MSSNFDGYRPSDSVPDRSAFARRLEAMAELGSAAR